MIALDSINFYSIYLPLYFSYGEYESVTPTITSESFHINGSFPVEAFLPFQPIKQNLETTQICDTADNYWVSNEMVNIISKRFFDIPAVECIFLSIEDDLLGIMTVINKYDKETVENIFNAEYDLLETFNDLFFNFFIIYREDREISDIWPQKSVVIFRR